MDTTNISCGFPFLDGITENWQQPQLLVLAARPSCCKTAFALNVVRFITVVEKDRGARQKNILEKC